jgi:hypothetical protein
MHQDRGDLMGESRDLVNQVTEKSSYLVLVLLLLLIMNLACNAPFLNLYSVNDKQLQPPPDQVKTSISQTLTARPPLDQVAAPGNEIQSDASEEVANSPTPSISPSPTITPSPTPEKAMIYISENTNCRTGPKDVYDLIHTFMAGDMADIIGKNQEETFWYIQDQEGGYLKCWLWGKFATPSGNTADLPVFTAAPTPTPVIDFTIKYMKTFSGGTKITVKITNTGDMTLESFSVTLKDKSTSESTYKSGNQFDSGVVKIPVGRSGEITGKAFSASTVGHKIVATIKICSDDSLSGYCTTRTSQFKSK